MGFNLIMVIAVSFVPLIMIIFGNMFLKNPPKKPNWAFGYRTKFSVKSQETWDFSQNLIGKYWKTLGLVLLPNIFILILAFGNRYDWKSCGRDRNCSMRFYDWSDICSFF